MHILTSLGFGGVERRMQTVGKYSKTTRMKHVFVSIGRGGETEQALRESGADVICLNKSVRIPSFSAIISLISCFRRYRPVAVHTHGSEANFHGLIAAWLARVPVRIGEEIGVPNHSWKAKQIFRIVFLSAKHVICMSKAVADWIIKSGEVPRSKALLIHNPVELPFLREKQRDPGPRFRVGFVGRLEEVKNPVVLIGMISRLNRINRPTELWIIGEGSQRAMLEEKSETEGVADQVIFKGYQKDPAHFIRQCDLCIQPSLSEGFSQSLVEAMGCGVAVVVTATGGAREVVEEGKTGWIVSSHDEKTITDAVVVGYDLGPEGMFVMGKTARTSVEKRFDPNQYIRELEDLYLGVKRT
jgi:glycosyltransferase involved in cell wall biosynthesis